MFFRSSAQKHSEDGRRHQRGGKRRIVFARWQNFQANIKAIFFNQDKFSDSYGPFRRSSSSVVKKPKTKIHSALKEYKRRRKTLKSLGYNRSTPSQEWKRLFIRIKNTHLFLNKITFSACKLIASSLSVFF